jgi:hypothetical protein
MGSHVSGNSESRRLCENLYSALNRRIPDLVHENGKNKCKFGIKGARRIFAWVNTHGYRHSKIEIWFLGNLDDAKKFKTLDIRPRRPTNSSWDEYKGRFDIVNDEQLKQAIELLISVSCPASR